jgi:hypothetical protein
MEVQKFNLLHLILRADALTPVGIKKVWDASVFLCRSKTAIARLFTEDAYDLRAVAIKDDDRHAESEMLEVLADTKEIRRDVVVHLEVLYLLLHFPLGFSSVIHQARAIADLSIEYLTCGERLVRLDKFQYFVRHLVVGTPRHILIALGYLDGYDIRLFAEHLG